ncbi:MAG: hypothetical protein R2724_05320 [Bryobacterales bacterium]
MGSTGLEGVCCGLKLLLHRRGRNRRAAGRGSGYARFDADGLNGSRRELSGGDFTAPLFDRLDAFKHIPFDVTVDGLSVDLGPHGIAASIGAGEGESQGDRLPFGQAGQRSGVGPASSAQSHTFARDHQIPCRQR